MISKQRLSTGKVLVTFTMPVGTWADSIHLVGDFNNWDTHATPLHLNEDSWSVTLELEAGKTYQYRYLINDTEWCNDWRADSYAPNDLGGDNSVVVTFTCLEPSDQWQPDLLSLIAADYSDFLLTSDAIDGTLMWGHRGKHQRSSSGYAFAQ